MVNFPKVVHFLFLTIATLLMVRILAISFLNFSFYWLIYVAIMFITVYFPFTFNAFNFYQLSISEKLGKYFIRVGILDLFFFIISSIPYLYCAISGKDECYVALLSISAWILLGILIIVQLSVFFIILLMHLLEKFPQKTKYVLFIFIIFILIFFNFYAYLIPGTSAMNDQNTFFQGTNQCGKLDIFGISQSELGGTGCGSFYMFDKDGPKKLYGNVAPITAFRQCYYEEANSFPGSFTLHYIDCKEQDSYSEYSIKILDSDGMRVIPKEYMEEYDFNQDDSYFEVCKVILSDYITDQKEICLNK